jgi:hypothetical protein
MQRTRVGAVLQVCGEEVAAAALQGAAQAEAILRMRQTSGETGRAARMQGAQRRSRAARLDAVQEVWVLRGLASPAALEAWLPATHTFAGVWQSGNAQGRPRQHGEHSLRSTNCHRAPFADCHKQRAVLLRARLCHDQFCKGPGLSALTRLGRHTARLRGQGTPIHPRET